MTDAASTLIKKEVLYAGTKSVDFKKGSKVHFNYQTRLCNAEFTLIDDSKKVRDGKPLELVLGKQFKLAVWEAILTKMALNEVAVFTVDKSLVQEYPFVSKTLRDISNPERQNTAVNTHCCGMMLESQGVGYDDLNQLLRNPQDLQFTIELVNVEAPDDYQKDTWQLSETELLNRVQELRLWGNAQYKKGDCRTAIEHYTQALSILETLLLKEKPNGDEWYAINKLKPSILLNLAQCQLLQGEYYEVIQHCTAAIQIEPDNTKAYYRRAKAHIGAWNPTEAQSDFEKALELDATLSHLINRDLQTLRDLVRHQHTKDREVMKNLFTS